MKNLKVKRRNYHKGYTFAECVSKITITDNITKDITTKLDSYKELRGVKIVNRLGKGN